MDLCSCNLFKVSRIEGILSWLKCCVLEAWTDLQTLTCAFNMGFSELRPGIDWNQWFAICRVSLCSGSGCFDFFSFCLCQVVSSAFICSSIFPMVLVPGNLAFHIDSMFGCYSFHNHVRKSYRCWPHCMCHTGIHTKSISKCIHLSTYTSTLYRINLYTFSDDMHFVWLFGLPLSLWSTLRSCASWKVQLSRLWPLDVSRLCPVPKRLEPKRQIHEVLRPSLKDKKHKFGVRFGRAFSLFRFFSSLLALSAFLSAFFSLCFLPFSTLFGEGSRTSNTCTAIDQVEHWPKSSSH